MRRSHRLAARATLAVAIVLLLAAPGRASPGPSTSYPVAPLGVGRQLLSNLSAPSIGPGGTTSVSYRLSDPASFFPITHLVLSFELYALNGYPGDAVGPLPLANAPVLIGPNGSGEIVNLSLGSLGVGASESGAVGVVTSDATPAGTYAVRTSLAFAANGSSYLFESRGWFSESLWENATTGPNGSATLNASRLGVSGVVAETAIYVAPSGWPVALAILVAAGLAVVGLGAWLYFRKRPGSSSGAEKPPAPGATNAPSALGNRRSSPGDSRSN